MIDSFFEDRTRFVSPFKYTIFIIALVTFLGNIVIDFESLMKAGISAGASADAESDPQFKEYMDTLAEVSTALSTRFSQLMYILVLAPLFAFASKLFFKSKRSTFKEHYIMSLYAFSTVSFINVLFLPLMIYQTNIWIYSVITSVTMLAISMYTQVSYLKLKGFDEYAQSFLSFIIGFVLYFLAILVLQIVGTIILLIVRS